MTPEQVEEFQRGHCNHLGKALCVDGDLGPQTEWALDYETLCADRRQIIAAAQGYLGLEESPPRSNDDPKGLIKSWLTRCGAKPGEPWCAAFACWCLASGMRQAPRIAGAQALGKRFPATNAPCAGDLFWYPTGPAGSWTGHVGIVTGVSPLDVMTIEGNCDNAVRCVLRPRHLLRFSRTVDDTDGECPGIVPSVPPAPAGTR